ncbi:MAG TPA: hypothetical protein VKR80_01960, partial [Candidatus Limnocylindria bacterium]|nr:hypothetical protein [Candidatus Limnocylindria bacterium]
VDRARDIRPDFGLTPENASAVAEICARLGGLPLAIELAAARIRSLSPQAMLGRLDQRLALLTGGARDLPPRQRTLRGAIEWSYALLDPTEQLLFGRFSVFAGGCALEDAEAVLANADAERPPMLDELESLLAKSLIRQDDRGRFSMLATIREFAHERLEQSGGSRAFRERHARHYADLARRGDVALHSGEQLAWLDRFDLESDNFRAALDWCSEADGDGALLMELTAALGYYWFLRTRYSEAGSRFVRAIQVPSPTAAFATALVWASFFAAESGDGGRALDLARQAVAAARRSGDAIALTYALTLFGFAVEVGSAEARASLDEALATARRAGHDWWLAYALATAGEGARSRGDHDAALRWYAESRTAALRTGERFVLLLSAVNPAHILLKRGETATARRYFQESLALCRELGNQWGMAYALVGLGGVANAEGRPADAARALGAADAWFKSRGIQIQVPDRPDYERYIEQARAGLGELFADAWRDAHSLSLDDAAGIAS